MAQATITVDGDPDTGDTGADLVEALNALGQALASGQAGTARPTFATGGLLWADTSTSGALILKMYDGTRDVTIATINTATGALVVSGGVSDGVKGEITVSASGATWTINTGAITSGKLAASAVIEAKLADSAVSTAKIADGAVTPAKLATGLGDALPITAPDGAGNLSADVDTLGELVGAVDGLSLGGWTVAQPWTATTSGTSFDVAGIPATARAICVLFSGVSQSGSDATLIQIGDSGGIEAAGYISDASRLVSGVNTTASTVGFLLFNNNNVTAASGVALLMSPDGRTWVCSHAIGLAGQSGVGGGTKTLSDQLTQLRITPDGSDTFDAGAFSVIYQ